MNVLTVFSKKTLTGAINHDICFSKWTLRRSFINFLLWVIASTDLNLCHSRKRFLVCMLWVITNYTVLHLVGNSHLCFRFPATTQLRLYWVKLEKNYRLQLEFSPLSTTKALSLSLRVTANKISFMSLTLLCRLYAQQRIRKKTKITAMQNTTEIAAQTSWPTRVCVSDISLQDEKRALSRDSTTFCRSTKCTSFSFLVISLSWLVAFVLVNG